MSVYNGADMLCETIESILSQRNVSFEFIIVDDGSTDETGEILAEHASGDRRIRLITQKNRGLTRALIAGCDFAGGEFIARQDCGDLSLPGRLARLRNLLHGEPGAVMASCATRFVGPANEELYTVALTTEELEAGLNQLSVATVRGPSHHGSTMFRRSVYKRVGGYRPQFRVSQDLDLWMRLSEVGPCIADTEVFYQAKLTASAISATRRREQLQTAETILVCAKARREGGGEDEILARWDNKSDLVKARHAGRKKRSSARDRARFYYFLASILRRTQPKSSLRYYTKAIRASVVFLPAWAGLLRLAIFR